MREVLNIMDLIGTTYERLTIIEEGKRHVEPNGKAQRVMICQCSCGEVCKKQLKDLRKGIAKSCGCLHKEQIAVVKKGDVYNHWTVLKEVNNYIYKNGNARKFLCRCECGLEKEVFMSSLRSGRSKSCGCKIDYSSRKPRVTDVNTPIPPMSLESMNKNLKGEWAVIEVLKEFRRKGDLSIVRLVKAQCKCGYTKKVKLSNLNKSKQCADCAFEEIKGRISPEERNLINRFSGMNTRCYNPESKDYKHYGARGITICDEWKNDFKSFIKWALENGYKRELSLDRIDNNLGYSPDNCRFVTRTKNNRNMSRNVMSWDLVDKIRSDFYEGLSDIEIADIIGCYYGTISDVREFRTWKCRE